MIDPSVNLIWIPLFPLLGAVFNLLFGKLLMRLVGERLGKEVVHLVAIGAVAFSCFFTFSVVFQPGATGLGFMSFLQQQLNPELRGRMLAGQPEVLVQNVYAWIISGEMTIRFELLLDRLSAIMCMVVTGVGLLIHIFSVGYMAKDEGYHRYFAYLNLFMAAMLILVLGKSLVLMFVGWEGVGLCSYLLIGFWFTDEEKATAGRKAFIMNRIGDFGFILGMLLIYSVTNSLDYDAIRSYCAEAQNSPFVTTTIFGVSIATVATLCLFLGCTGKSAQIPLHTWLPDAMAGPTPVSALIHAATMVTAGVYLCVRLNFLFALAPTTMGVIALVGSVTALFAATIGITQNDIKKVLAWSTVSQLGYMFMAVGMGAWVAAIFHLVTHAFFKACLFLGSGSVIEACHHNQDIRTMGGLRKKMPVTAGTFAISCLAIAGIPPLAGFFSKDEILLHAYTGASLWSPGINYAVFVLGLLAALCTAFYMARLYLLTFEGKFRGDMHTWEHHVKEYPIMTGPLVILAIGAIFGGFLGYAHALPGHDSLPHLLSAWLSPIYDLSARYTGDYYIGMWHQPDGALPWFADPEGHGVKASSELQFMAVSVAVAAFGLGFAYTLYKDGPSKQAEAWAKRLGILYSASKAKYWVDEIYGVVVGFVRLLAGACYQVVDQLIVDGLGVGGVSGTVGFFGNLVRIWHNGNVRRYLLWLLAGVAIVLGAVYLNPTVSKFGPSELNQADLGGLRPTLGERPIKLKILGLWEVHLGPETPPPPPAARPIEKVELHDADRPPTRGEAKAAPTPGARPTRDAKEGTP